MGLRGGLIERVVLRGACEGRGLLSYISHVRVCVYVYLWVCMSACVYLWVYMCVCVSVSVCPMGIFVGIIYLLRVGSSLFANLMCREKILRSWESALEMEREKEFSR
jgi:hypothetical protein